MSALPPKPRFGEKCNGCGLCCAVQLCEVGELAFPDAQAPCPALKLAEDGSRTYCSLVVAEARAGVTPPLIAIGLGIGKGCGMGDEVRVTIGGEERRVAATAANLCRPKVVIG